MVRGHDDVGGGVDAERAGRHQQIEVGGVVDVAAVDLAHEGLALAIDVLDRRPRGLGRQLAALDQPEPSPRNDFADPIGAEGSLPSPRKICSELAPLSETKKMSVLSSAPIASICFSTRPISMSMR